MSAVRTSTSQLALGVALAVALSSCIPRAARFQTTDPNEPEPPRRPPGIAVDKTSRLPRARAKAPSSRALLVLASPLPLSAARNTIDAFFRALVNEAPDAVDAVLTDQAAYDSSAGRQPARNAVRSRLLQFDYTALRGVPLYQSRDVEFYRRADTLALQHVRNVPLDLTDEQLLVRVRLSVAFAGKNRVFSDQMSFLLLPDGARYRIAAIHEETDMP